MTQNDSTANQIDEDAASKSRMEQMVNSYDAYMRRITLGREDALREMTVNLAQVKPRDCVLEVGCGTGTLTLAAKREAGPLSGDSFWPPTESRQARAMRRKMASTSITIAHI
jgi:ubiquinone/menaquinone biosynthesis C-methylase UbiE